MRMVLQLVQVRAKAVMEVFVSNSIFLPKSMVIISPLCRHHAAVRFVMEHVSVVLSVLDSDNWKN